MGFKPGKPVQNKPKEGGGVFVIFVYARCQKYLLFAFWSGQGPKVTFSAWTEGGKVYAPKEDLCLLFGVEQRVSR